MGVYSPTSTPDHFSVPDSIGNDAMTSPPLPAAPSDPQAATYFSDSEYPPKPDQSYPTSRAYPYPPAPVTSLATPSTYAAAAAYNATYTGTAETIVPTYPTTISPSYMSPYGTRQHTWTNPSNGYGTYSPELMQSAGYSYQPSAAITYSAQMAMGRPNYPTTGYFLPQPVTIATSQSC